MHRSSTDCSFLTASAAAQIHRWAVVCLLLALPFCGFASAVTALLGAQHFHATAAAAVFENPAVLTADAVVLRPARRPLFAHASSHAISHNTPHATSHATSHAASHATSHTSAQAATQATPHTAADSGAHNTAHAVEHDHSSVQRHHHAAADDSVVVTDGGTSADAARADLDASASKAGASLLPLLCWTHEERLHAANALRSAWGESPRWSLQSAELRASDRPPKA